MAEAAGTDAILILKSLFRQKKLIAAQGLYAASRKQKARRPCAIHAVMWEAPAGLPQWKRNNL